MPRVLCYFVFRQVRAPMELIALPSANLQRCVSVRHCKVMYVDHGNFKGCRIPSYLWLLLNLIQFSSFHTHHAYLVWAQS